MFIAFPAFLLVAVAPPSFPSPRLPDLRLELFQRMKVDQDARKKMMSTDLPDKRKAIDELRAVDTENTRRIREVVARHGWPGRTLVGVDGAHAVWLLVQHADHDRAFQKECLEKMRQAAPGEVSGRDIAYLTDRVLVGEGKPQRYGTQLQLQNGKLIPQTLETPGEVDRRRGELGMEPLSQYLEFAEKAQREFARKPTPDKKP